MEGSVDNDNIYIHYSVHNKSEFGFYANRSVIWTTNLVDNFYDNHNLQRKCWYLHRNQSNREIK